MVVADRALATFIFVCSTIVAISAYSRIAVIETPEDLPITQLKEGIHRSQILANTSCIGAMESSVTSNGAAWLTLESVLNIDAEGTRRLAQAHTQAEFNALGQMTSSATHFLYDTADVKVSTQNINPLHVVVVAHLGEKEVTRNFDLPGPILLQRIGAHGFQLQYGSLSHTNRSLLNALSKPFLAQLNALQISLSDPVEEAHTLGATLDSCAPHEVGALDISPALKAVHILTGQWVSPPLKRRGDAIHGRNKSKETT